MEVLERVDRDRLAELRERDEFFWLDVDRPEPGGASRRSASCSACTRSRSRTPIEFSQRPKLDSYGDHVLFVFYTVRKGRNTGEAPFEPVEVHIYISGSFVVTVRRSECTQLDALHHELDTRRPRGRGLHRLQDLRRPHRRLLPDHRRCSRSASTRSRATSCSSRPSREQLAEIYRLKQRVHELSRRVVPQRDRFVTGADAILDLPGLARGTREYLRDVGDHLAQIAGELHRQQEDLTALTATYFNANANRLNAVATRLTIGGTLFLVWTLVTGFFGQNFGWLVRNIDTPPRLPRLRRRRRWSIPTVIIGTLFWVKRKDWF